MRQDWFEKFEKTMSMKRLTYLLVGVFSYVVEMCCFSGVIIKEIVDAKGRRRKKDEKRETVECKIALRGETSFHSIRRIRKIEKKTKQYRGK